MKEELNEKNVETNRVKIDYGVFNYFPAIIDYDFEKKRPRGLSCRVDFFSYGTISNILDNIEMMPHVFIRKKNTFFENGMLLVDFSAVIKNPDSFIDMIKKLKTDKIYLENSKTFSLNGIIEKLDDVEIVFMEV